MISLSTPSLSGNEESYVSEAIKTEWVSTAGPYVDRFSAAFVDWLGGDGFAVPCASGTAALHLSLLSVGVKPGDDVLVSSLTFVATANAIAYCGANPIFIDSEKESANLDPNLVVKLLHERAKENRLPSAIVPVHLYGHPVDMQPILDVAEYYGVPVIEDAAESLGATYDNRPVGTLGRTGVFSFNGNKIMTCGGGGMVFTRDERIAEQIRHLSTQSRLPGVAYVHDQIGFNYRMTSLAAAVGLAQIEQLDSFVEKRRSIANRYAAAFSGVDGLEVVVEPKWGKSSYWLSTVSVNENKVGCSRDRLIELLGQSKIESRPFWFPLHRQPAYKGSEFIGSGVSDMLFETGLCLPSSAHLTERQQGMVIDTVVSSLSA